MKGGKPGTAGLSEEAAITAVPYDTAVIAMAVPESRRRAQLFADGSRRVAGR